MSKFGLQLLPRPWLRVGDDAVRLDGRLGVGGRSGASAQFVYRDASGRTYVKGEVRGLAEGPRRLAYWHLVPFGGHRGDPVARRLAVYE